MGWLSMNLPLKERQTLLCDTKDGRQLLGLKKFRLQNILLYEGRLKSKAKAML